MQVRQTQPHNLIPTNATMSDGHYPTFSHTSHRDPFSLTYFPLPGHPGSRESNPPPACSVTLLHSGYIHSKRGLWADDAWDHDETRRPAKREQQVSLPIFGAVLRHGGETWLWDLGESE